MEPVEIFKGNSPLILSMPHTGTYVPDEIMDAFNPVGRKLADTDWHIHKLYKGLAPNATTVRARFHRYVIDANRDPSGQSLYPGQNTTGLCPFIDFDNTPLYQDKRNPCPDEIERRRLKFHKPYHDALDAEIRLIHKRHGIAILYDCHSIRANIPFLFDGKLPDFNIGTNTGTSCAKSIEKAVTEICENAPEYCSVTNGRFKGGWTTRHYGNPENNIHAVQMELAQNTYMQESEPWTYLKDRAEHIRPHLQKILETLEDIALQKPLNIEVSL